MVRKGLALVFNSPYRLPAATQFTMSQGAAPTGTDFQYTVFVCSELHILSCQ